MNENKNTKLTMSVSPHFKSTETTMGVMLNVIIALLPALIASIFIFKMKAFMVIATSVISCVLFEYIARKIMKKENTIYDLSAVVTGILLAFNLPSNIPLWIVVLGALIAIVVVKQFFGGLGQNFVNPALAARIILMSSFPARMSSWPVPGKDVTVTGATPMALLKQHNIQDLPSIKDMLFGMHGGSLGETCAIALILGGLYLIIKKVITPTIPLTYIATVAIGMLFASKFNFTFMLYEVLGGGLLLGAIFMATDYVTCPVTEKGRFIYALCAGILTLLIRLFASMPEGVSFSILLMNIFTPQIDKISRPKPFGFVKEKKAKKVKEEK